MKQHLERAKEHAKKKLGRSWRTSAFGWLAVLWGLWLAHVLWVPSATIYFNLVYVMSPPVLFILVGVGLIHACDDKHDG